MSGFQDFQGLRRQLLARLVAGEVGRDDYEWTLGEIDRHEQAARPTQSHRHTITNPSVALPSATGLHVGAELGVYRIERLLGRGGMGEVWLAWEDVGGFYVVVKALPLSAQSDEDMHAVLAVFHRVRLLQHQHVCPVYTLGLDGRFGYYFVMKYVEGVTLSKYRRACVQEHGHLPRRRTLRILRALAEALDYAHSRNVVHRDVKPQNVMVGDDGQDVQEVQLVDFGLAALVRATASVGAGEGLPVSGTPAYMAPEQWTGDVQDGRTDQYGLAAVAYELLAGCTPFTAPEALAVRHQALHEAVPPISTERSSVNEVLARALAKHRADRFDSCRSFVEALATALGSDE